MAEPCTGIGPHQMTDKWSCRKCLRECICERLNVAALRGKDDQRTEWQSVLSSTNARAAGEALDRAYDEIRAMNYRCVGAGRPRYVRKADALAVISNLRSRL